MYILLLFLFFFNSFYFISMKIYHKGYKNTSSKTSFQLNYKISGNQNGGNFIFFELWTYGEAKGNNVLAHAVSCTEIYVHREWQQASRMSSPMKSDTTYLTEWRIKLAPVLKFYINIKIYFLVLNILYVQDLNYFVYEKAEKIIKTKRKLAFWIIYSYRREFWP